jgi:hypothetical protein
VKVALSLEAVLLRYIKRDRGFLPAAERTNKVKSNLNKKPRKKEGGGVAEWGEKKKENVSMR